MPHGTSHLGNVTINNFVFIVDYQVFQFFSVDLDRKVAGIVFMAIFPELILSFTLFVFQTFDLLPLWIWKEDIIYVRAVSSSYKRKIGAAACAHKPNKNQPKCNQALDPRLSLYPLQ